MMYRDEYHPQVKKDLKKTQSDYHLKFARQEYRIAYVADENTKTVSMLMIGKRGEFYRLLKRRIKT